jgi:Fe-S-cluster containining protein
VRALKILGQRDDAIRERTRREIAGSLGAGSIGDLAPAAVRAHQIMDQEGARARAAAPAREPACAAGCSYCCHVHAYATVPEIIAVAEHLRRTLDPEALGVLRAKLSERAQMIQMAALDDDARWAAKIPCALLDARGACSIYDARPLRCRAFHSCDARECKDAFEGREDAAPLRAPLLDRAMDAVEAGYDAALAEACLSVDGFMLEIALSIALDDPSAGARFLAGEPVFDAARPLG